jgi:outer membrane protein assembly factor BamA
MIPFRRALLTGFALSSSLVCFVALAQGPNSLTYTAGKVVFKNAGDFSQAEMEAVSGIHGGSSFKAAQLNDAAQKLSDTGYFESVGAAMEGMQNKVTVTFDMKPFDHAKMLPVGSENFVWLSQDEIAKDVAAKLPLYNGTVMEATAQVDSISDALTAMLKDKGISARVVHETVEPTLEHPARVEEFRIASPRIVVTNVHLSGVQKDLVPYLQKAVNETARTEYNEGRAGVQTVDRVLGPLRDAGYSAATLTGMSLAPTAGENGVVGVVVSGTLSAGDVYHVGKLEFAGTELVSADAFAKSATLHSGDVDSHKEMLTTLAPLDTAYRSKGYMDVVVLATPTLHAADHTADYVVTVVPGDVYRVHEIRTVGLEGDAKAQADYARGFLMKSGDVYNPEYIKGFLKNNTALQALNGYSAGWKAAANPETKTVDLAITFYKGGAR